MLKHTVAMAFVAVLALAFAGDGSADPQKPAVQQKPPRPIQERGSNTTISSPGEGGGKSDLGQQLQFQLNEANNIFTRTSPPQPGHGQSGGPNGMLGGGLLDGAGGVNQNAAAPTGTPAARNSAGQVIK